MHQGKCIKWNLNSECHEHWSFIISADFFFISENNDKFLSELHVGNGSILKCDDFLQSYELKIIIAHK